MNVESSTFQDKSELSLHSFTLYEQTSVLTNEPPVPLIRGASSFEHVEGERVAATIPVGVAVSSHRFHLCIGMGGQVVDSHPVGQAGSVLRVDVSEKEDDILLNFDAVKN